MKSVGARRRRACSAATSSRSCARRRARGFDRGELRHHATRTRCARASPAPTLIINCAAFTNVDGAESDEAGAYRANALGAENVARAARALGATLVHVSTDFVFDGAQAEPYDEFERPNPQSIYARSKWAGEELARARRRELFLVRVQGLYGAGGRTSRRSCAS